MAPVAGGYSGDGMLILGSEVAYSRGNRPAVDPQQRQSFTCATRRGTKPGGLHGGREVTVSVKPVDRRRSTGVIFWVDLRQMFTN